MNPELILFDLDDTLMAFDIVAEEAWNVTIDLFVETENIKIEKNFLLEKINRARKWYWSDAERHRIGRKNIINARREIVHLALKDYLDIDTNKLNQLADNYSQTHEKLWYLFEGAEDTLEYLKKKDIKLGLMTNGTSESQRNKINRFNLEKYFDYIFIESEVGYGKPDLRMYQYMLNETKIENSKITMVGDNLVWDIEPPKNIGIYTIWINTKGHILEPNKHPDKIIEKITDIKSIY